MKKRLLALLLVIGMLAAFTPGAAAQDYYFNLAAQTVDVYLNADGSVELDYVFVFNNQPGGATIEYVDVGMPNGNFDWGSVSADIDGNPLGISSDFQGDGPHGFAVEMGAYAIPPGQSGSVHVRVGRIEGMFYPDSDDQAYASSEFSPAYFVSSIVTGLTELSVNLHLPPGVTTEEGRWHPARGGWPGAADPEPYLDQQGRVTYSWTSNMADASTRYTFGASFPRQYIPEGVIVSPSLFDTLGISTDDLMGFCCFGGFLLLFIGSPILSAIGDRRRKLQYLPPKIRIEGHGIKRGLTAVEAAIVMEEPLDKVMTMILFGVIKKGAAEVTRRDPLEVRTLDLPEGAELREYEKSFLAAFAEGGAAPRRRALQEMTVALVRSVSEKMKGFSRKETVDYYRTINQKAWQQIEAADTPEVKSERYEQAMEWTMLDKDYDDRTRRVFTGPIIMPTWWGRYDPTFHRTTPSMPSMGGAPAASGPSGRTSLPGADLAASMVTGVQTFSSKVIGDLNTFTGGVTKVTNPPPPPSRSSSGGGGRSGGGCACACACAGCACACAGGGR